MSLLDRRGAGRARVLRLPHEQDVFGLVCVAERLRVGGVFVACGSEKRGRELGFHDFMDLIISGCFWIYYLAWVLALPCVA